MGQLMQGRDPFSRYQSSMHIEEQSAPKDCVFSHSAATFQSSENMQGGACGYCYPMYVHSHADRRGWRSNTLHLSHISLTPQTHIRSAFVPDESSCGAARSMTWHDIQFPIH